MPKKSNGELYAEFKKKYPPEKLVFRAATESWELDEKPITKSALCERLAFTLETSPHKMSTLLTVAAWDAWSLASKRLRHWIERLEMREANDAELRKFIKLIQRKNTTKIDHESHMHAMRQWIWMVKRHVLERDVIWHVAPIFWSTEGGTGKSTNIKRLIEPFAEFQRTVNVDELGEKFSGRLLASTRIAFLDEFAGADKVNAGHLKGLLTGKPIDRRSMHSETGFFADNRTSCIASSNMQPPHGFIDYTGGRRFWSIHCSGEAMKKDSGRMAAFDALDVEAIWCAVSANDECPEYTVAKEVREHMTHVRDEALRTRTSLRAFVEDKLIEAKGNRLPFKEFQRAYKDYCAETRQVPFRGGYRDLTRQLKTMEYTVTSPNNYFYLHDLDLQIEQSEDVA